MDFARSLREWTAYMRGIFRPPQTNIELTPDWKLYEIKFTDLKVPPGANPGSAFDGTNAMLLGWHSDNADFDVYLDQVEFFSE